MSEFTVYSIPGSPFGRSVLAALEEKRAAYKLVPVAPGTFRSEVHLARHPFGRVPVIEHGDFRLYETQAILRYIDRILTEPSLTPNSAQARARMDQAMAINDWYLFQGVANVIVFHRIVSPRLMGGVPDEGAIAEAMPKAETVIAELSRLLGEQPYFAGEQFSLADLHLGTQISMLADTPEWARLASLASNIDRWLKRVEARPSFRATTWEAVAQRAAAA